MHTPTATHDTPLTDPAFLSTQPASRNDLRVGQAVILLCAVAFLITAPFAKVQLPQVWAFIPLYQGILVVTDLITAVLLFGQFHIARNRALLVLASGYLFTALVIVAHTLSFPGVFSPTGLMGAGSQTTVWLYTFWHGGFPLFVIAYSFLRPTRHAHAPLPHKGSPRSLWALLSGIVGAVLLAGGAVLLTTVGHDLLPEVMQSHRRYAPAQKIVLPAMWLLSALALAVLWHRRPWTVLDLWLMVVMSAWVFDIALSAVLNGGRFDLGFYAGRIYGLLAASFVLLMLLLENSVLYARLVEMHTRSRHKARELQQLGAQLEAVNTTLADKNKQLEESSRLKSEFLSTMSHELRTPLNAIIGFSEMMKDGLAGALAPSQQGYVGHIFHSGQHLLSLINDILDLSKIEAGKVEIDLEAVDLGELLDDCMGLVADRAAARHIRLLRHIATFPGMLGADRRRLRQIVDNLLSNAMKFTPAGGQVTVHASVVDRTQAQSRLPGFTHGLRMPLPENAFQRFVEISVLDTGIGIQPSDMARLFTPFTQVSSPLTRSIEGTGLGLAMVRRLVELHGGTVAVSSEPGTGSCFSVWMPWRDEPGLATQTTPHVTQTRPGSDGPLALVVEDDDKAATLMQAQLEAEGFRIHRVVTAEAALKLAPGLTPDLITLDLLLPGMDGWDMLARIKEVPTWTHVPVVVVSVVADEGRGLSLGAALVLQKPVSRDALSRGLARLGLQSGVRQNVPAQAIDQATHKAAHQATDKDSSDMDTPAAHLHPPRGGAAPQGLNT